MWFNSKQREEPYQVLTSFDHSRDRAFPSGTKWQVVHGCRQLVSWDVGLSPATSATLITSCQHWVGHSSETAGDKPEEGGDDVKSSCPLWLGLHSATMDGTTSSELARVSESLKAILSSDCRLQLAYMKPESLVIADQHAAVNTFPGLVHTARHTTRVCNTQSRWGNLLEPAA